MHTKQFIDLVQRAAQTSDRKAITQICKQLANYARNQEDKAGKARIIIYQAVLRQNKLHQIQQAYQLLQSALKLQHLPPIVKVQVLCRLAFNRFISRAYDQSIQRHLQAVQESEKANLKLDALMMGIYTNQANPFQDSSDSGQSQQVLSIIYQQKDKPKKALEYQKKAYTKLTVLGNEQLERFADYRLCVLEGRKLTSFTFEQKRQFRQRNQTLLRLFEFASDETDTLTDSLAQQKRVIIRKLQSAYRQCQKSGDEDRLQQLRTVIQELKTSHLPLSMAGSSSILEEQQQEEQPKRANQRMGQTTSRIVDNWQGSDLIKINYNSEGEQKRYFYLVAEENKLYYCSKKSKKDPESDSYYSLKGLKDIKLGKMTNTMRRKDNQQKVSSLCFSLEFDDRTRDFTALNQSDYNKWIQKLEDYLQQRKRKKDKSMYGSKATKSVSRGNNSEDMKQSKMKSSKKQQGTLMMSMVRKN